jgi:hypothetical protein
MIEVFSFMRGVITQSRLVHRDVVELFQTRTMEDLPVDFCGVFRIHRVMRKISKIFQSRPEYLRDVEGFSDSTSYHDGVLGYFQTPRLI